MCRIRSSRTEWLSHDTDVSAWRLRILGGIRTPGEFVPKVQLRAQYWVSSKAHFWLTSQQGICWRFGSVRSALPESDLERNKFGLMSPDDSQAAYAHYPGIFTRQYRRARQLSGPRCQIRVFWRSASDWHPGQLPWRSRWDSRNRIKFLRSFLLKTRRVKHSTLFLLFRKGRKVALLIVFGYVGWRREVERGMNRTGAGFNPENRPRRNWFFNDFESNWTESKSNSFKFDSILISIIYKQMCDYMFF